MRIQPNGNLVVTGTIQLEAFQTPDLLNGFVNYGSGHATAAYYKDKMDVVHLRGLVDLGSDPDNLVIFTLPAGYRPSTSSRLVFTALNNDAICRVDVHANGNVQVITGSTGWISLEGIRFRAD